MTNTLFVAVSMWSSGWIKHRLSKCRRIREDDCVLCNLEVGCFLHDFLGWLLVILHLHLLIPSNLSLKFSQTPLNVVDIKYSKWKLKSLLKHRGSLHKCLYSQYYKRGPRGSAVVIKYYIFCVIADGCVLSVEIPDPQFTFFPKATCLSYRALNCLYHNSMNST